MRAPPLPYAPQHRLLSGAAIVCLHAALLFAFIRNDLHGAPAAAPPVYAQLLLLQPVPIKPAATPPPSTTPTLRPERSAHQNRPAPPAPRAPSPAPDHDFAPAAAGAVTAAAPADTFAEGREPAAAPSEKLDVFALVAAAGANERARTKEPLERVQNSQRVRAMNDSDAARGIAKAGRADCTKKYSGGTSLDPLKLIPLLYDTLTDTGCKW